jgi:hypothetical protein
VYLPFRKVEEIINLISGGLGFVFVTCLNFARFVGVFYRRGMMSFSLRAANCCLSLSLSICPPCNRRVFYVFLLSLPFFFWPF